MKEANCSLDPLKTLTVREAAELLHVSQPTVREHMKRRELPGITLGRCRRIRRADLEAFTERRLTCDYWPMDNRHRRGDQHVPNEDGYLLDPASQDGAEASMPF